MLSYRPYQPIVAYEARNLVFDGTNYIDTDVYLFSAENVNRNFEIIVKGATIDNTIGTGSNKNERALIGSMYEVNPYPGFLVRGDVPAGQGVIAIRQQPTDITIKRINGIYTVVGTSIQSGAIANATFDIPVTLGCEMQADKTPFRYVGGSIDYISIRWLS